MHALSRDAVLSPRSRRVADQAARAITGQHAVSYRDIHVGVQEELSSRGVGTGPRDLQRLVRCPLDMEMLHAGHLSE